MLHLRRRRPTRVWTRVLGLAVVPMLAVVASSAHDALERARSADQAERVEALVERAGDHLRLHLLLANEAFGSGGLAAAEEIGVPVDVISQVLGFDLVERIERDRSRVDAALAELGADVAGFADAVADARGGSARNILTDLGAVQAELTRNSAASLDAAQSAAVGVPGATELHHILRLLRLTNDAASATAVQLEGLTRLLVPAPPERYAFGQERLRLGNRLFAAAEAQLDLRADDEARGQWAAVRDLPGSRRTLERAEHYAVVPIAELNGMELPTIRDTFFEGLERVEGYAAFNERTAQRAVAAAAEVHAESVRRTRWAIGVGAAVALLALVSSVVVARSLASPLRRLAADVRSGDLGNAVLSGHGPRELVEVGDALADAVTGLRTAEVQLTAMAEGRLDDVVGIPAAPGRMGALVHGSIARLSQSMLERERLATRLEHEATHDGLTGLPNLASIRTGIAQAVARSWRQGSGVAVVVVELDGLKRVLATYGHDAGDRVVEESAQRLRDEVRGGDLLARVGTGDFAIVTEGVTGAVDVAELAERLVLALSAPVAVGAAVTRVGASIGAALVLDGDGDPDALLRDAGLAAGRAREAGGNRLELFDQSMRAELLARADIESRLADALTGGELALWFQPVVDPRLQTTGAEALLRWIRPDGTVVPPGSFIPTAEESDLIIDIGRWVMRTAVTHLARWADDPVLADLHLSVNLSGRHLLSLTVVDDVRDALAAGGVDPRRLTIEITETVLLADFPLVCDHLDQLRSLGVRIAVDDFGTGYTSLAHIRNLPTDCIKLDRSLIVAAARPADRTVVELVVGAAHAFGMEVVAEGIETDEQLDLVRSLACDQLQGFLVARPADEATFRAHVAATAADRTR